MWKSGRWGHLHGERRPRDHGGRRRALSRSLRSRNAVRCGWYADRLGVTRKLRHPLPGRVAGSDMVIPLVRRAEELGKRVYFLGGADGVAARAVEVLRARFPKLIVAGVDAPIVDMKKDPSERRDVEERIKAARADLVFVALGAPKQELWIDEVVSELRPAVLIGVGASLDFIAGVVQRAPRWMADNGLEWFYLPLPGTRPIVEALSGSRSALRSRAGKRAQGSSRRTDHRSAGHIPAPFEWQWVTLIRFRAWHRRSRAGRGEGAALSSMGSSLRRRNRVCCAPARHRSFRTPSRSRWGETVVEAERSSQPLRPLRPSRPGPQWPRPPRRSSLKRRGRPGLRRSAPLLTRPGQGRPARARRGYWVLTQLPRMCRSRRG